MQIEAISGLVPLESASSPVRESGSQFSLWFSEQMNQVEQNIQSAEHQVQKLAIGEADNLHQVMIAISKAQTSFDLMVQVRNRLVESSQELMRMSI